MVNCRGGIRTMIVTGDHHHTAIATARDVGMISMKAQIIVIDTVIPPHPLASPAVSAHTTPAQSARNSLDQQTPQRSAADLKQPFRLGLEKPRPGHAMSFMQSPVSPRDRPTGVERRLQGHSMSHIQTWAAQHDPSRGVQGASPVGMGGSPQRLSFEAAQPSAHSAPAMQNQQSRPQPSHRSVDSLQQQQPASAVSSAVHRGQLQQETDHQWDEQQQQQQQQQQQTPLQVWYEETQQSRHDGVGATHHHLQAADQQQQFIQPQQQQQQKQQQQKSRLSLEDNRLHHGAHQRPAPLQISSGDASQRDTVGGGSSSHPYQAAPVSFPASSLYQTSAASPSLSGRQHVASLAHTDRQHVTADARGSRQHSRLELIPMGAVPRDPTAQATLSPPPSRSARQLLAPLAITPTPNRHSPWPPSPAPGVDGLQFVLGLSNKTMSPIQALTALAEGRLQCAITGSAFQHLLESSDLAPLEIVMRSVVVFARMQPQHKGKAVELLTVKGVHQMHDGAPRHIQVPIGFRVNLGFN